MPGDSTGKDNPIQRVIDAIAKAKGLRPGFKCFLDCNQNDIEALAKHIIEYIKDTSKKAPLLIRMPFGKKEKVAYQPWITLLESVMKKTRTGIIAELDEVIPEILKYTHVSPQPLANAHKAALSPPVVSEISSSGGVKKARENLFPMIRLEPLAESSYSPAFSHLTGGLRPLLIVLDDYSNYLSFKDDFFELVDDAVIKKEAPRFDCDESTLKMALGGYCGMLNNLAISYEIQMPMMWLEEGKGAGFGQLATVLPMAKLEEMRPRIAAFIVDLEWRPLLPDTEEKNSDSSDAEQQSNDWRHMGHVALNFLSRRFPEIPSFIYTGDWELRNLQDGLVFGAEWCFRKWESHHPLSVSEEGDPLNIFSLQQHLITAAESRYQAFSETPFPAQLQIIPSEDASKDFLKEMKIRLPLERDVLGQDLQNLMATLFPGDDEVCPVKVFGAGKSKAQATFVARPSRNGLQFAPRFMKAAPWFEIQREYLAFQRVIRPRLGSYVANIVDRPVLAGGLAGEMPLGALVYSLAGLPEGYEDLKPLDELIKGLCHGDSDVCKVKTRLQETLQDVLRPLYGAKDGEFTTKKKPLWAWLGEVLPPAFTGVLVPLVDSETGVKKSDATVKSRKQGGLKDSTAWLMAARDTADLRDKACSDEISPWNYGKEKCITLSGFILLEAAWDNDSDTGEITLAHPDLGWRIRLRGKADDIRRRFGAIWARPGMPVDVVVCIEKKNRETEKIEQKLQAAFTSVGIKKKNASWLKPFEEASGREKLPNPFDLFGENGMPFSFTIPAHEAPIHGDLNLHNILFSGDSGPGWLIDFDRANLHGMPAFDLAKLEAEIWHHHLFPLLKDIASGADDENEGCLKLLNAALTAADAECSGEMFTTLVRTKKIVNEATNGLLLPVCNLLDVIDMVREFGRKKLKLDDAECRWALASYLFTATKFAGGDKPWRAILSFFASAWRLSEVAPDLATKHDTVFDALRGGELKAADPRKVDGLLIRMSQSSSRLNVFTRDMAAIQNVPKVEWGKGTKCWDLASTGSVANITPIFGYLWLMVKAHEKKEGTIFRVVVPKISSRGASCGTIDTLEAGGLNFPVEPGAIKNACESRGGVLCSQHKDLTPVDKALMKRRKETNTMKNVALVYASIMAKKIAMGCTHAIIDVKVGRDTKILAPWMSKDENKSWWDNGNNTSLIRDDMCSKFMNVLKSKNMLGIRAQVKPQKEELWVTQNCRWNKTLSTLEEVRWFFTNADVPQCRAIGRQLILLHLDDLILGTYSDPLLGVSVSNNGKRSFAPAENEYCKLYLERLPGICNISNSDQLREKLTDQWRLLKNQLPLLDRFVAKRLFNELNSRRNNEEDHKERKFLESGEFGKGLEFDDGMDLKVMTLGLKPYQLSAAAGQQVKRIDAWELDSFFDRLCGDETYDPEVGIYLHRLPGERVVNPGSDPFISIFFRPSRTPEADVLSWARTFLSQHIELGDET